MLIDVATSARKEVTGGKTRSVHTGDDCLSFGDGTGNDASASGPKGL